MKYLVLVLPFLFMDTIIYCSLNRLKLLQKEISEKDNPISKSERDWANYAAYFRYIGKRSDLPPESPCSIHVMTLTELYHIVKEEADMFESCLYKEQEEKRFEKRNVPEGGCQVYKQTLLELFEIVKEESELYENCMSNEENQV